MPVFYLWSDADQSAELLFQSIETRGIRDFLVWHDEWIPVPTLAFYEEGYSLADPEDLDNRYLFDVVSGSTVKVSDLKPSSEKLVETKHVGATEPRFTNEINSYLKNQSTDIDRAQYLFGLGRANVANWEQARSLEHLEAIFGLVSYVGTNAIDDVEISDWETYLYPVSLLADAWIVLGSMKFNSVDLLNWGFSDEIALGFAEIVGIHRGALKAVQVDPSNAWAFVTSFILQALAERNDPNHFDEMVEMAQSTMELFELPVGMKAVVDAHWQGQIYPGH